jgi:hypothetical protein
VEQRQEVRRQEYGCLDDFHRCRRKGSVRHGDPAGIDAGLPADFLNRLTAAADALGTSLTNRGNTAGTQVGATQGLKAESARGREAVKVLDSLIEPQLAGNTVLLVQWTSARKFGGKSTVVSTTTIDAAAKGPSGTVIPPAPTPPATTTPATTTPATPAATPDAAPAAPAPSTPPAA